MKIIFLTFILFIGFLNMVEPILFRNTEFIRSNCRYVKLCPTNDSLVRFYLKLYRGKTRDTVSANINVTNEIPFDKAFTLHFELWKWADGGWKRNFFNIKRKNACSGLHLVLGPLWKHALDHLGTSCPIPAGNYTLNEYSYDQQQGIFPIALMPGRFYLKLRVVRLNMISVCVEADIVLYEYTEYM